MMPRHLRIASSIRFNSSAIASRPGQGRIVRTTSRNGLKQSDPADRRSQGIAPDAKQPFLHVAQDFSNQVVTLETAWRAASHETIMVY